MTGLYFVHPLKTGGTSVRWFLRDNKILHEAQDHSPFIPDRYNRLVGNWGRVVLFTVLRDPVDQIHSLYSYAVDAIYTEIYKTTVGVNFSQWIRSFPDLQSYFVRYFNSQKVIDPNSRNNFVGVSDSIENAKKILDRFDYVLDMATLKSGIENMMSDLGYNLLFNLHYNASVKKPISKSDVDYIKNKRAKDYELLKHYNIRLKY